jgi:hypothetical protein
MGLAAFFADLRDAPGGLAPDRTQERDTAGMVRSAGFEPTTTAFGGQYSIQLSYERMVADAVPSQRLIPRERSIAELP